jgi:hypothetical protein
MRISNSEIQTFKRCKRKWYFNYYLGLKRNIESAAGAAPIGTRLHSCLDVYYKYKLDGLTDMDAQNAAMVQHEYLAYMDVEQGRVAEDDKKFLSEVDLTRIMLIGYFDWLAESGADEGLTVVAAERAIEVDTEVEGYGPVTIMGKLDLLLHRELDDANLFIDHKSVMELTTPAKWLHLNEQFKMYDWLLRRYSVHTRSDGGMFNLLRKVKRTARANPPFYGRLEVRHSDAELASFEQTLGGEIRDIMALRTALDSGDPAGPLSRIYPTPTSDCSWQCPYFQVCPMVDRADGSASRVIELTMHRGDPYERYDNPEG